MIQEIKQHLWRQFGASIDMFRSAVTACPDDMLVSNRQFFIMVYHTLFFLDYYLTNPPDDFAPLLPLDKVKDVPARQYSKDELLEYVQCCREKCRAVINGLTEDLSERWIENAPSRRPRNYAMVELLMYNMRHVQHHTAQLNMMLRREIDFAPDWVSYAKDDLR